MPAWPARDVRPPAGGAPTPTGPPPGPPRPPGPTVPSGPPGGVYPPPPGGAYAPPLAGPPGAPPLPPPLPPPGHYPVPAPPPSRFAPPAVVPAYAAAPPQSASADGEAPAPWDEGADDYDTAATASVEDAQERPWEDGPEDHGYDDAQVQGADPDALETVSPDDPAWAMTAVDVDDPIEEPAQATDWLDRICPYLLSEDGTSRSSQPDERHRCTAQDPPATLPLAFQERFCLTDRHVRCEMYKVAEDARSQALAQDSIPAEQVRKARFRPTVRSRPVALESSSSAPADPPAAAGPDRQILIALGGAGAFALVLLVIAILLGGGGGGGGTPDVVVTPPPDVPAATTAPARTLAPQATLDTGAAGTAAPVVDRPADPHPLRGPGRRAPAQDRRDVRHDATGDRAGQHGARRGREPARRSTRGHHRRAGLPGHDRGPDHGGAGLRRVRRGLARRREGRTGESGTRP